MNDLNIQQITYYRVVKPPTLKQFLHRKFVHLVMDQVKGAKGTIMDPETKKPAPVSAVKARDLMQGKTAEDLMKEHPEWVEEFNKERADATANNEG